MNSPLDAGRPTILIVDDTPDNITLLGNLLRDRYRIRIANNGERGLQIAGGDLPPDLILLDVMMPGIDGYEVCRRLKADPRTARIPVIFLTALVLEEDEERGLQLGAVDYITKPITPSIVLARVATHLALRDVQRFLEDRNAWLEEEVQRRVREVAAIQDVVIVAMASLAETRDNETGNHLRRVREYVRVLAGRLCNHPRFAADLDPHTIDLLGRSAPLHDIGKVGIPDRILLKPGRLTADEFEIMKTHTTLGRDAIATAEQLLDSSTSFLRLAREIAHSHQEKWDGSGYPQGLAGEAIPVSARLMAVADVYDAIISRRVYKPPMSHEDALDAIRRGRGSHFDPDVADAFLAVGEEIRAIAQRLADGDQALNAQLLRVAQAVADPP